MELSIVICTFNRAFYLQKCLEALTPQNITETEIIVIDNNSTDNTREIVEYFQKSSVQIRYFLEQKVGLSHARNRGLKEAKSEWVCYVDDDAIVMQGYVQRVISLIKSYPFDFFGGKVTPLYLNPKPEWIPHTLNRFELEDIDQITELSERYVIGANMIMRKKLVSDMGGFSPELGMQEGKIRYAEEDHIQHVLRAQGYKIAYDPLLSVEHIVLPQKTLLKWHLISKLAHARDSYKLCKNRKSKTELVFMLCRSTIAALFKRLPYAIYKMISDKKFYWQNAVLLILDPIILISGMMVTTYSSKHPK